ncbi:MAG TPA: hypothetical protein PLL30_00015 [Candidatus Krumholzibacteria bacterium]|nr:hypothetical protein [Candidatus Krumholzibacteria bacterium]HPD70142.1 hypothetical protein [Candidatus Krumholzibacteria bacterium]HRY40158.1 hypothetical protein [Candidatus Krumholzibacteria bacterium]
MKRVLFILAAGCLTFVLTLAAAAIEQPTDPELQSPPADGLNSPAPPSDDRDEDVQGALGDPHDLGGGFRDHANPPVQVEIDEISLITRLILLLMRSV